METRYYSPPPMVKCLIKTTHSRELGPRGGRNCVPRRRVREYIVAGRLADGRPATICSLEYGKEGEVRGEWWLGDGWWYHINNTN